MESLRRTPEGGPLRFRSRALVGGAVLVLGGLLAGGACNRHPEAYRDSFLAMDSTVELTVVAPSTGAAQAGFQAARREVERLEAILSDYRPESNVAQLNRRATDVLAPETRLLLERAQRVCRETDGAFDVTLRPIKHLWGFGTDAGPHVPDSAAVQALLPHIGCDRFEILSDGRFVWHDPEAAIDLGGIAQGFVAGCVAESLRALGLENFLIDVSGDLVAGGHRPDGRRWRLGIQNPRRPDSLLARMELDAVAVTTSGDYEQFFIRDGVRYHHIFDPRTGWPARGVASVTVFSDDPVAADCYATAIFVLGPERGLAFLRERSDLRGAIVTEMQGTLHVAWDDEAPNR